jgi:acyl dehydratase
MTAQIQLDEIPHLGEIYARILGRLAQAVMSTRQPTTLPDVRYVVDGVRVDGGRLSEYQRLLGEPGTDALPAGYVHVLGFPLAMTVMARPDFPLPPLGMIHLANRIEQVSPISLDEALSLRAWAQDLRSHRSGTAVDLVVEVRRDGSDDVAWRGVSSYLAKGRTIRGLPPAAEEVPAADARPPVTARWRLPADSGRRYGAITGDRNPIHLWAPTARLFGFRRPIAHGMDIAARALAAVGPGRGESFVWTVEFGRPVLLPSTVTFGLEPLPGGGHRYAGWDARSGKGYFSGSVTPR